MLQIINVNRLFKKIKKLCTDLGSADEEQCGAPGGARGGQDRCVTGSAVFSALSFQKKTKTIKMEDNIKKTFYNYI